VVAVTATTEMIGGRPRVRLNEAYVTALTASGLVPLVTPPLSGDVDAAADAVLAAVSGLVLTGGEDVDPAAYGAAPHAALGPLQRERDAWETALVHAARRRGLPTLAICRGVQVLNVALGGSLVQDLPSERPSSLAHEQAGPRDGRTHEVLVTPGSRLHTALGDERVAVNSMHHQAVDRVGDGLVANAVCDDGVIEGVESRDDGWWAVGVQWHPEELTRTEAAYDRALFAAFAERCRAQA
jgi:putative glutamine amidotransferase